MLPDRGLPSYQLWHLNPSSRFATTDMGRKFWGCAPFEAARSPPNTLWPGHVAAAYLHAKFHLDPSGSLATIRQRYRQTGQRPDSTGRTVLGRPFVKRFALSYRIVVLSVCLSVTLVYCGQTVAWIKIKLGMQVDFSPGHIVLDGDPASHRKRGIAPNFRPMSVVTKFLDRLRCHLVRR